MQPDGENVGEADAVVFHPQRGLIVLEVKAGAVKVVNGVWFYASGKAMKESPFKQARQSRYALIEKLCQLFQISRKELDKLGLTHAAWFPDVRWSGPCPVELPSQSFLLDRRHLDDPELALIRILQEAVGDVKPWSQKQQNTLKELLAPDCHYLVPLVARVDDAVVALYRATEQQMVALRMLRLQPRLLVEGGAGTGKTVLAGALAREHAALGKSVLLTCFNKALAQSLSAALAGVPGITVLAFHELARARAMAAGLAYTIPADPKEQGYFFREESAKLLLQAAELGGTRYDTLIVDEAADFAPSWWVALEALGATADSGKPGYSWYCFYDRQQCLFQDGTQWEPPFAAEPMLLDANLRNTRPIGELAARLGQCALAPIFLVQDGDTPVILLSRDFASMAEQLRTLLRDLMEQQALQPEQIAVLSPYRHTNPASTWTSGLDGVVLNADVAQAHAGQVRVGTIQGFKGLESDVVILVGIDAHSLHHPSILYVGASRARAALFVLALKDAGLSHR